MSLTFLNTNTDEILKETQAVFEDTSGRTLYPAQVENLLLHTLAYRESLLRHDILHCAEQNLVDYAVGEHLDALGANRGCSRLQPVAAECRIRFTLQEPTTPGRTFPAGTRITTDDGRFTFETVDAAYVITGQTESTEVTARCTSTGTAGNGLKAGDLCELDPKPKNDDVTAGNISPSDGGGDLEGDEPYRRRILLSIASYGCGGSEKAYRYWALSASSEVADALPVRGEDRGDINIYVLATYGNPTAPLLAKVQEVCNSNEVSLINDYVRTISALRKAYSIKARITIYSGFDSDIVMDKIRTLAHEFALEHRTKLGMDVTPTQIKMAFKTLSDALYQVDLIEPVEIVEVGEAEYAEATEIEITLAGVVNG